MKTLVALLAISLALRSDAAAADLQIPFEIGGVEPVMLIRATANGKPALMILDTGSSRTILRPELLEATLAGVPASSFNDGGPGLNVRGRWARATIRLGDKTWRRDVVAMDFAEVSRAFGMKVDGLIGQDILREFDRVTIDFAAQKIVLSKGKKDGGRGSEESEKSLP